MEHDNRILHRRASFEERVKTILRLALLLSVTITTAAQAQGSGRVVGTQCWINGKLVGGFPAGYTCPGTGGGAAGGGAPPVDSALYNSFYQLGYQFGRWLVGGSSDPQAELQKQQMMAELRRRQAEAERQHREEEAQRLAAMYNRLVASLKLSGLPNLQLKEIAAPGSGLQLKVGETASGEPGIKGLPGMYLGDQSKPYGIPRLPGIYTGGPRQESGLTGSKLQLKTGEQAGASPTGTGETAPALTSESGLQLKSGGGTAAPPAQGAAFNPSKMTPQQLADVAEAVSKLTPEDQQRLLAGQQQPSTAPRLSLKTSALPEQHAEAARAAAGASSLEEASAKARAGFDQPVPAPVQLGKSGTPLILRPPGTSVSRVPGATSATTEPSAPAANDWVKQYLFPDTQSSTVFPKNPNPPLTNPLREEQKLQAELKSWDDWAVERATHVYDKPADQLYPVNTERELLNAAAVKQHAPELLDRYNSDTEFRQRVNQRLQYGTESVALNYYQDLANAHKAAILEYRAELEKLAAAGKLDSRVSLEDQYRLHPERHKVVQAVWDRVSNREQAALAKVRENVGDKLDKEYQFIFRRLRDELAPPK